MASALVQFRTDDESKIKAMKICEKIGIDLQTYMRMCIARLIQENGVPFSMKIENEPVNKGFEALKAASKIAEENGFSEMTLEEINAEIAEARKQGVWMKYYAVIDTNVLVSAILKWKSIPGKILELTFNGLIVPWINDEILKEYREVLSRPKFKLTREIVDNLINGIMENSVFVNEQSLDEYLPDPKDRVFYEVVMEERKNEDAYLVTGNIKHFPIRPYIVTPREMLDIMLEENWIS